MSTLIHHFGTDLAFSKQTGDGVDAEIIKQVHASCVSVERIDEHGQQRAGIDYVATLSSGQRIRWEVKRRRQGCSTFWKRDPHGRIVPELCLELWSVSPGGDQPSKIGWALNDEKRSDYILFTFAPEDYGSSYAIPFPHLRSAFQANRAAWVKTYKTGPQENKMGDLEWKAECVFIPIVTLLRAINEHCVREPP